MADGVKVRWGFELLLTIICAAIFGSMTFIALLVTTVRKGASRVFSVQTRDVRPEVLSDSALGTHGFVRLRSIRLKLHYVASGPTNKPLMLFVHGFPEFWYSWRHQLKEFSKDYRAVAFDMRGYGDSDKPSGIYQYTLDKLVEDIDQLITELGYEKCVLVGHDWGGAVAWGYAALHPDRVEKLVVGNIPHPAAMRIHLKSSFSQLKKSWYMFLFQVPVLPLIFLRSDDLNFLKLAFTGRKMGAKQGAFTAEDIEAFKYTFANYDDLCGPVNFYRSAMRYQSPQVDEALKRKISVPSLVIWGTNDGALEREMAEISRRFVEKYTVHYIEGASHWIQQDEPEQFNSAMRQFLSSSS